MQSRPQDLSGNKMSAWPPSWISTPDKPWYESTLHSCTRALIIGFFSSFQAPRAEEHEKRKSERTGKSGRKIESCRRSQSSLVYFLCSVRLFTRSRINFSYPSVGIYNNLYPNCSVYLIVFSCDVSPISTTLALNLCLSSVLLAKITNNNLFLDEVEHNIVICLWRADQLFSKGWGK